MTSRKARILFALFLLIVGVAGAYLGFDTYQQHARVFANERAVLARLDAMLASVNELAVAQRGYFEPARGGNSAPQVQRVRQLTQELRDNIEIVRTQVPDPAATEQLSALATALDDFTRTDTRVRTNLVNDTYFSAADLVFSASANELRSVTGALVALKDIASKSAVVRYAALRNRVVVTAGIVGLVWLLGLLVLTPVPAAAATFPGQRDVSQSAPVPESTVETPAPAVEPPVAPEAIDLQAAAAVCASMAKASSAAELREVLADAADVLGATGLIVWLGAGEELFPVLGHGYDPRMLARIGPLSRQAPNATAIAWRQVEMQSVAGDQGRASALVAPMVGAQGCIGVLSVELAAGRELDRSLHAVTRMFAAQLSTIVAAWPEPSASSDTGTSHTGTIAVTL